MSDGVNHALETAMLRLFGYANARERMLRDGDVEAVMRDNAQRIFGSDFFMIRPTFYPYGEDGDPEVQAYRQRLVAHYDNDAVADAQFLLWHVYCTFTVGNQEWRLMIYPPKSYGEPDYETRLVCVTTGTWFDLHSHTPCVSPDIAFGELAYVVLQHTPSLLTPIPTVNPAFAWEDIVNAGLLPRCINHLYRNW